MRRFQFRHSLVLAACIAGALIAANFSCLKRGQKPPEIDMAFYQDEMPIPSLLSESDGPERRASMRLLEKSWEEERLMGNPRFFEQMEKAMAIDAQNPFLYYFMAKKSLSMKKWEKAKLFSQKAQAFFGQDVRWQAKAMGVGVEAAVGLGKISEAKALWERAKMLDPENPHLTELGALYFAG